MREIKFRGFSLPEQRFVFGNYVKSGFNHFIAYDANEDDYRYNFDGVFIPCDEKSIGQFTGLTDKNSKEIFEGDIINYNGDDYNADYMLVVWNERECRFQIDVYGHAEHFNEGGGEYFDSEITKVDENIIDMSSLIEMKVIGNIHENTELL